MKKARNFKYSLFIMVGIGLGALSTGCGSLLNPGVVYAPEQRYRAPASYAITSGDEECDLSSSNVTPGNYDSQLSHSGEFKVCLKSDVLEIHGKVSKEDKDSKVCVFPAANDGADILPIYTPGTQVAVYQCGTLGSAGFKLDFQKLKFNAVYIVEGQNLEAMRNCLSLMNGSFCPYFSVGKI